MTQHSLTMSASHVVRLYLWSKLQEYLPNIWKEDTTSGLLKLPIIPAQEQPEVQDTDNPYMVYVYDYAGTTDLFQFQEEVMNLQMFSQRASTIAATTKLIMRLLNKHDITAREINNWIDNDLETEYATGNTEYDTWIDEAKNFRFKTVTVSGTQGTRPAEQEGGRLDSVITINMRYIEREMGLGSNNPFA